MAATMTNLFRRRAESSSTESSASSSSSLEDKAAGKGGGAGAEAIMTSEKEIEPLHDSLPTKKHGEGIHSSSSAALPPLESPVKNNNASLAAAAAPAAAGGAGGNATEDQEDTRLPHQREEVETEEQQPEPVRERAGSVSYLLSSLSSFSSNISLNNFLTGEDDSITTPQTGPAKLGFSAPSSVFMQAVDFVITFLLVHYIQVFYTIVFGLLYLFKHGHRWPLLLAFVYIPLYIIPFQRLGGWPFKVLMRRPFWRCVQRTLNLHVEREVELDPKTRYIFGWHPHGILLLSRFAIYGGVWEKMFPGVSFKTLAASPLFWIPPIREVSILLGGVDAGRAFAARALRDGYSVSLYPGGSKEIYTTNPYTAETRLILKIRKGFIKLALKFGAPLVPVYIFGEKYAYHRMEPKTGFASWLLQVLRVPFLIFWGRWCTFMPLKNTQVSVVVGTPLPVPQIDEPSPEVVQEWLDKYCQAVQDLFQRHKHKYAKQGEFVAIS